MTSQSLKKLIRERLTREELNNVFAELSDAHDRVAAIIIATLVEDSLEDAILSKLRPLTAREHRELFDGDAPLASFSAKIRIAYAIGFINPRARDDLVRMKDIRNAFAHAKRQLDFSTPQIAQACAKFAVIDTIDRPEILAPNEQWPPMKPRLRYVLTARFARWALQDVASGVPIGAETGGGEPSNNPGG